MKVLSVRQPWAHLIVNGQKKIENRTWKTPYRGPVLIHAARKEHAQPIREIEYQHGITIPRWLDRGGLIGMAEIVDVVSKSDDPFFEGPYGFVLRNARKLPFIPCSGKLYVYPLDGDIEKQLRADPLWRKAIG